MNTKFLAGSFALCLAGLASAQLLSGNNLIVNPGFDDGPASAGGGVTAVPGWQGNAGVGIYGVDQWWEIPAGPWSSGNQFFQGGSVQQLSIQQTYTLTAQDVAGVTAGNAVYTVSGWFGGWQAQNDHTRLSVSFRGLDGSTLGTPRVIGGFDAAARSSTSGMLFDTFSGQIDPLTRSIDFVLTANRFGGSSNDGVADTMSFTAVPEPASMTALALGAALLWRRRRKA